MSFKQYHIEQDDLIGKLIVQPSIEESKFIWQQVTHDNDNVFLSWMWIGSWLKLIKENSKEKLEPNLFVIYKNEDIIAAVFLIIDHESRYQIIHSRQLFINEIGSHGLNMVIEYNTIAVRPGYEEPAYQLFSNFLMSNNNWDELVINAMEVTNFEKLNKHLDLDLEIMNQGYSRQASINLTEHKTIDSLKKVLLSKNKRSQISRSKNHIESQYGKITVSLATSLNEALVWFSNLGELHTTYWQTKGHAGAFANPHWVEFNQSMIKYGFDLNQVHIIKIQAGDFTIGYLYNLILNDTVYNIQSGFNYLDSNKFKPGFLSHWLAIEYYCNHGFHLYDFLAGGEAYKESLSNLNKELIWCKIKKPKLLFSLEKHLKYIKHQIQELRHTS